MKHTEVKLQLPFSICDRCSMLDVSASVSAVKDRQFRDVGETQWYSKRNIIVVCKNREACERLYRMISEEVAQAQSGGDGVDKTVD